MGFTRRGPRSESGARSAGLEAAVGLVTGGRRDRRQRGLLCSHCGSQARVDMIDMPRTRAYLTCPECGHKWDTERMHVSQITTR